MTCSLDLYLQALSFKEAEEAFLCCYYLTERNLIIISQNQKAVVAKLLHTFTESSMKDELFKAKKIAMKISKVRLLLFLKHRQQRHLSILIGMALQNKLIMQKKQ